MTTSARADAPPPRGGGGGHANRIRTELRALRARLAARDPGWRRAKRATGATAGAAISLAVNTLVAHAVHESTGVALLGAVVAMIAGLAVTDETRRDEALTFAVLPVVASASVALGAALAKDRFVADAAFIVIVFAATALRRRGPRWSASGFLAFMAYFFSQFLHAIPAQVPWLALAALIGVVVAATLRLAVLPDHPERTLRQLLRALNGQAAQLLDTAVDVLEVPRVPERLRRRAVAASGDLNRVALLVEQQLGLLPGGEAMVGASETLRDRVFMVEVAAAHTVSAVRAAVRDGLPVTERRALATELTAVSRAIRGGRSPAVLKHYAKNAVDAGADGDHQRRYHGAVHIRRALGELADAAAALQRGGAADAPSGLWLPDADAAPTAADAAPETEPHLGLKQAVQASAAVSLAIIAGESLSPQRWYWAAIAAYIVFVGADTRGATLRRAVSRTVGTLAGLICGLAVAALISGSKPAALVLIFGLLFVAWWLQPVSFFASSIAVTVVLALLYVLLGMFSGKVLLLRVEETAIGAVLGGLAAAVLVPARSSPAVLDAEADVLDGLGDLLRAVRDRRGSGSALRAVDNAFQRLRDVARPVSQGVPGAGARLMEQRVFALSAASYSARMLVTATVHCTELGEELADQLGALADRASGLAAATREGAAASHPVRLDDPVVAAGADDRHPAEPARSTGRDQRSRTHALVAVERLGLALTRWSDPTRAPLPPTGEPATAESHRPRHLSRS